MIDRELVKRWEGFRSEAYQDPVGVWTIGYGTTKGVKPGMWITREQADALLDRDLEWARRAVEEGVKVPLSPHQKAALVSLTYNIGETAFKRSTLLKLLNRGDYAAVPAQIRRWNRAGGKVLKGLVNRREDEVRVWNTPSTILPPPRPFPRRLADLIWRLWYALKK